MIDRLEVLKRLFKDRYIIDGHWIWTGNTLGGYGRVRIGDTEYSVHRLSYYYHHEDFDIEDSESLVLHKNECHIRHCFNPDHLYLGTHLDNALDRSELVQQTPNFGRCGHPRTKENSKHERSGMIRCKACAHRRDMYRYLGMSMKTVRELENAVIDVAIENPTE